MSLGGNTAKSKVKGILRGVIFISKMYLVPYQITLITRSFPVSLPKIAPVILGAATLVLLAAVYVLTIAFVIIKVPIEVLSACFACILARERGDAAPSVDY
jgi:hydrogenase-4 membrane subunit HyfE